MTASLIVAATQGNPVAIERLMNRSLNNYGFSAKVSMQGSVLSIVVEGNVVPCVSKTTKFVRKGLRKLAPATAVSVRVYGKAFQNSAPTWERHWTLKLLGILPEPSTRVLLPDFKARTPILPPQDFYVASYPIFQPQTLTSVWKQRLFIGCVSILLLGFSYEVSTKIQSGRLMLAQAETLENTVSTESGASLENLQATKTDLQSAIRLLEQVPGIPGAGKQLAIQKLPDLQERLKRVERQLQMATQSQQQQQQATHNLESAKQLALEAAYLIQSAPDQPSTWEKAEEKWQQAITRLEAVPKGTIAFDEAQKMLIAYQDTHNNIAQRLTTETDATSSYELASQWIDDALQLTAGLDPFNQQNLAQLKDAQERLGKALELLQSIPANAQISDAVQERLAIHTADYVNLTEAVSILELCSSEPQATDCPPKAITSTRLGADRDTAIPNEIQVTN